MSTLYSVLFTAIGTAYGGGDGVATFNLPDLRGRFGVGYAASGGHSDVSVLGANDGSALAARRPRHKHAVVQPSVSASASPHSHQVRSGTGNNGGTYGPGLDTVTRQDGWGSYANTASSQGVQNTTVSISASASGGTVGPQTGAEPTDTPAYVVVNHIIKT